MSETASKRLLPAAVLLLPLGAFGQDPGLPVHLDLGPESLTTEFVPAGRDALKEARVKAGLGLRLGRQALELDVGYKLRGRSVGEHRRGVLSQRLQTRVSSQLLDSLLGMNLGLDTDSVFREGGDAYLHVVRPGLSGRIQELAQLKLQYEYALDKPSPLAPEHARSGYQLSVDGALQDGALTWGGRFSSRERFDHNAVRTRATDTLDLTSRLQLARSLHVELTGALRNETRFSRPGHQASTETRFGAALGWSPSGRYALGLKVDSLESEAEPGSAVLGSGSISWFPRPDLELKLDYSDRLVEGEPGWVLHTRFDPSG